MTAKRKRYPQPIYYKEGYKYQLVADFVIDISTDIPALVAVDIDTKFVLLRAGVLTIRAGYAWDGPSGPTIDTPSGIYASIVHDALYQMLRLNARADCREAVDKLFEHMLEDAGMWGIRARLWFAGVRAGGGSHIDAGAEPPVLTAP
jgi:hypothetical protein